MMGEHVDQHLVSRTYLRAWSINGHSLVQMDKEKKTIERINLDHHFYTKHEYTIIPGAMHLPTEDMDYFFHDFQELSVEYDGMQLNTSELLNQYFPFYDQWEIYDQGLNKISHHKKNKLRNNIQEKRDTSIESQLQLFETKWPEFRDELIQRVFESRLNWIDAYSFEYFVRFMVLQHWRGFDRSGDENKAFQIIENYIPLSKINIPPENRTHKKSTNARQEISRDFRIKYFRQFFNNEGPIHDHAISVLKKATLEILVAPENCSFITSDSPCYAIESSLIQLGLAISPSVYIAFTKKQAGNGRYVITHITASNVDKINMITCQKADRYVIGASEADLENLARIID